MPARRQRRLPAALTAALLLASLTACGSGGDGGNGAPPPGSATARPGVADRMMSAPLLGCDDRVEAESPEAGPAPGPEAVEFGAVFGSFGPLRGTRPGFFFREPERRYAAVKLLFGLRAGSRATLTIPPGDRMRTGLNYTHETPADGPFTVANGGVAVRFEACPAAERAREYDGTVGEWTEFSGEVLMAKAGCHVVELHMAGAPAAYSRRLSVPAGRCRA